MRPCLRQGNVYFSLYKNYRSHKLYKQCSEHNEAIKFEFAIREFCSENTGSAPLKTVASIQNRTRSLLRAVREAQNEQSLLPRLIRFNSHVLQYIHSGRNEAIRAGAVETVLELRKSMNIEVKREARKGLVLLGWIEPVKGWGVRILTIDGGGSRYNYIFCCFCAI